MVSGFVLAAVLIELTPGPNMTWLAVLGASYGRRTALGAVVGICLGLSVAAAVAGFGLNALLFEFPQLYNVLRWAGALYLLYLAGSAWVASEAPEHLTAMTPGAAFRQGLISNILNPKAYIFYAAVLPPFVDPSRDVQSQIIWLSVVYVVVATSIHSGIALAAGGLAEWLRSSPEAVRIRKALAALIALTAIWFYYSTGTAPRP